MNTKQMDTLLKLKSSGKVLKSNLDHFKTVKDIIKDKLIPDLTHGNFIEKGSKLQLSIKGLVMVPGNRLISYGYSKGDEILVDVVNEDEVMPDNTIDNSVSGVVMSKLVYNMDYHGMLAYINDIIDFPEILVPCLNVFVASVNAKLIPLEPLFKILHDSSLVLLSLISKLLLRYGGSQLVTQNSIVNASLILLGTVFSELPMSSFDDNAIYQLWMSVLYVLDSCMQTYNPNRRRSVCMSPPFYGENADSLEVDIQRNEEEQTITTTTAELVVYLFSRFFEHNFVLYQLRMDYALESMIQLMESSSTEFALLTMFFFSYGHAVSEHTEMSSTELSLLIVRYIMIHFNEFVNHCLSYMDDLDIMDTTQSTVHFSAAFTYCLASICSTMNEELDNLFKDDVLNFLPVFKTCLEQVLSSYQQASLEKDREDFLYALQNLLRLLTVLTYDTVLCHSITAYDSHHAKQLIHSQRSGEQIEDDDTPKEVELIPLLCYILEGVPNDVCVVLVCGIIRNLSACKKLKAVLSINNKWFHYLSGIIQTEFERYSNGNPTPFSVEQLLFATPSMPESSADSLSYLEHLLGNVLRAVSNLVTVNSKFVNVFTKSELWNSGDLLEALKTVRYGVSFTVTTIGFLQTVILRLKSGYSVNDLEEIVNRAKEGIETEQEEMKEKQSILSQRAYSEYLKLYEEAKEWINKMERRLASNDFNELEPIALTPIPDSEISSLLMTYPLGPMSVSGCYQEMSRMLTLASMFITKEGEVPNMDNDMSIDLFVPLDCICTAFNLIFGQDIVSIEHDSMILNPFSRLFEHVKEAQTTLVIVTRNPLQAVDSTVHTLSSALTRNSRKMLPLGNTETLQRSIFNMLNEHTLRMVPLEMEAIDDTDEIEEEENEKIYTSHPTMKVVNSNPTRMSNRDLRSRGEAIGDGASDGEGVVSGFPSEIAKEPLADDENVAKQVIEETPAEEEDNQGMVVPADEESTRGMVISVPSDDESTQGMVVPSPYRDGTIQSKLLKQLMVDGTISEDMDVIENFKLVHRNLDREGNYTPIASTFDLTEVSSSVRLKMKRMIKHLRDDPENDLHSLIVLDFMSLGDVDRCWYVLQFLSSDLSMYSVDDYEQVLRGCVEIVPKMLDKTDYSSTKNDVFLVMKFITDISAMNNVLEMWVLNEGSFFVDMLRKFNALCMRDTFEQYQDKCFAPISRILKNIAEDDQMRNKIVEYEMADLLAEMLLVNHVVNPRMTQLVDLVAVLKVFTRSMKESDVTKIKEAIRQMVDEVTDSTCKRRLLRIIA